MCTSIIDRTSLAGSGKGPSGWFDVKQLYLGYDHPVHVDLDHAVLIDFVNEDAGERVAVELPLEAACALASRLLATLAKADGYEDGHSVRDAGER